MESAETTWGSPVEIERRRRILLSVWAYAYEMMDVSLVDDHTFDAECLKVNLLIATGNKKLDKWWRSNFDPSTGMWVRNHPEQGRLRQIAERILEVRKMESFDNRADRAVIAARLVATIDKFCEDFYGDERRKYLGGSQIGKPCERALWYSFRWCAESDYINAKGENHKGRMFRLFNRGHREEERILEWLRGIGCEVQDLDPATGKQWRMSGSNGHYGGSCDGKIKLPTGFGYDDWMLAEFKTHNDKSWKKMQEEGVIVAKPEHYGQMCAYGIKMSLEYALYVAVNKDTDAIYIEIVRLDPAWGEQMNAKADRIINSPVPPPKLRENSAHFDCKFCDFAAVCHSGKPYDKSCRSCKFAQPVEGGQWLCHNFGQHIPAEFMPKGCDAYQEAK